MAAASATKCGTAQGRISAWSLAASFARAPAARLQIAGTLSTSATVSIASRPQRYDQQSWTQQLPQKSLE
eukprot:10145-Pyramimonas_sp.AAC.1